MGIVVKRKFVFSYWYCILMIPHAQPNRNKGLICSIVYGGKVYSSLLLIHELVSHWNNQQGQLWITQLPMIPSVVFHTGIKCSWHNKQLKIQDALMAARLPGIYLHEFAPNGHKLAVGSISSWPFMTHLIGFVDTRDDAGMQDAEIWSKKQSVVGTQRIAQHLGERGGEGKEYLMFYIETLHESQLTDLSS